jgi:alpha-ketoglutarate-dependent taurine dioxygenase
MGRETSIVRFEDGEPIPRSLIDEVVSIQQRIMIPIAWKKGDFTLLDNTRTLHGRRAFTDTKRDVYLRMVRTVDF